MLFDQIWPPPPSITLCHTWLSFPYEKYVTGHNIPLLNCMHLTEYSTVITKPYNICINALFYHSQSFQTLLYSLHAVVYNLHTVHVVGNVLMLY